MQQIWPMTVIPSPTQMMSQTTLKIQILCLLQGPSKKPPIPCRCKGRKISPKVTKLRQLSENSCLLSNALRLSTTFTLLRIHVITSSRASSQRVKCQSIALMPSSRRIFYSLRRLATKCQPYPSNQGIHFLKGWRRWLKTHVGWAVKLEFPLRPKSEFKCQDILQCIKYLLRQRAFVNYMLWAPVRSFNHKGEPLYSEMNTGSWWWAEQLCNIPTILTPNSHSIVDPARRVHTHTHTSGIGPDPPDKLFRR